MQIFSAVGPLGAGKTTLTINTIEAMIRSGMTTKQKCAYIINDEGANVDGSLIERSARVLPMTSGCFTCSDEAQLRKTLDELYHQEMEWIFLEGFGMTSGNETKKFLKSVPYPFRIICVLDFHNHERNLVRYADVVKSQVHAATIGTGITKYGQASNLMELPNTSILDFVAKNSHGKPAFLIPEGSPLPFNMLETSVVGQNLSLPISHDACSHHGHDHGHHHHVHAMFAYSYELRGDTKFSDLVGAFEKCPASIWRLKGAVEGKLFNAVFDDWRQTTQDDRCFVTFYSREEIFLGKDLPQLANLIVPDTEVADDLQSYQLIRKEGISEERTIIEIQRLMDEIPLEPVIIPTFGNCVRLITHPEVLQILKEISRRPRIKEEWFPRALKRCMEYWIKCAGVLFSVRMKLLCLTFQLTSVSWRFH